ncbi:MAG TPA: NUDIX domain-containing protein [Solirubrobacteraceae bacterium]|nr:NUDIX domain-containing protein [Solirubrobacteraceae bacterium]
MAAEEFSAGGVVLHDRMVAVIVPVKRDAQGRRVLGLPKGHPEGEESPERAAEREVREETGLEVELVERLGEVSYQYERHGRRVAKRVAFYLFRCCGGNLEDHDHEIEEARWMPLEQAAQELSYAGEREMVERAGSILAAER